MRTTPLPLLILTGFLGSGKTSTLRHWLTQTSLPLRRMAVIINDFGEINVDAALLAQRQMELRSLTGGCACCQTFAELVQQVARLAENPEIDLVWIETSGLADPEEILDHLSAPALQNKALVRRVVMVLDGTDYPCSWRGREVQNEQIQYANLLLLNKTDRLTADAIEQLIATLHGINAQAEIIPTIQGQVAPEILSRETEARALPLPHDGCGPHHEHEHPHPEPDSLHAASTLYLPLPQPVEEKAFHAFLAELPRLVFRAKGFVRFLSKPELLYTFQHVRDQSELILLPLTEAENLPTGLVFIGPQLPEKELRDKAQILLSP